MMHRQVTQASCGAATTAKPLCRSNRRHRSSSSSTGKSTRRSAITTPSSSSSRSTTTPATSSSSNLIVVRTRNISRPANSLTSNSSALQSNSPASCSSSSNSSSLLSVLAWSMTLLLVSSCLGIADAGALMGHPFSKRSFMDIQCKGVYDKSLFARLDRICEDCYNLFREPQLHTLCRKNCFTSDYFKGCLDVLLLQDEMEWIQTSIKQLHGADPGV